MRNVKVMENDMEGFDLSGYDNQEFGYASMAGEKSQTLEISKASRSDWYTTKQGKINGELDNISKGVSPICSNDGSVSVKTAIELCQKAYWNISVFRSTIETQTEFCNSKLHFRGRSKKTENFFKNWYEKINGWNLSERFFREWFRSGNVFLFRFDGDLALNQIRKLSSAAAGPTKVPLRYIILNPADMRAMGSTSFLNVKYSKVLNKFELERLKNPKTQEEIEFFNSLSDEEKKSIKSGSEPMIYLDQEYLRAIFCGKQDYEAMAVPQYYSVLPDLNFKMLLRNAETVLARTVDLSILVITCGDEKRSPGQNKSLIGNLTELFASESVGRVLISDWTTKGEFLIPDLARIFGSQKYETVNQDIANGLANIFYSDEKFANSLIKTQIFLEKLNQAREAYLNHFLKPEMKRIAQDLGFQGELPEPIFEDIVLNDGIEEKKIYVDLLKIGALTPEEAVDAIETGILPLKDESIQRQQEFKKLKDKGLYQSMISPPKEEGRPPGSKSPKKKKTVGPIGASVDDDDDIMQFSMSKISENLKDYYNLESSIESEYKKEKGLIRLSKKHKDLCKAIGESIVANEEKENWKDSIAKYISNPLTEGDEGYSNRVMSISAEHQVNSFLGAILLNSILKNDQTDNTEI